VIRDVDRLASRAFDLLVVGGGIYGLSIAYDAAQRGLAVALIERNDFGSGASFNHLRTIHGGLRYLQTLDIRRARESVRERRTLARIAPDAVRPLRFVLPLSRSLTRGTVAMRAGFALDSIVSFDRNRGVDPGLELPSGRVISEAEALQRFPALRGRDLTGVATWHDYVTTESDRLTFAFAAAADKHGAVLANYVEAAALLVDGAHVRGVRASDRLTGRALEISARMTVNAAGASVARLTSALSRPPRAPMLKAMNLVTRREAGDEAVGSRSHSGRYLFLVPWRGRALFGTWESAGPCETDDASVTEVEVAAFMSEINQAFPSLRLTMADVALVHRGIVPAVVRGNGTVTLEKKERIHDHAFDGTEGIISVSGTKYTTARACAERATDLVLKRLRMSPVACRTATTPLIERGSLQALSHSHLDDRLRRAVREEMALTLCDAMLRRTPAGAVGFPGESVASHAADVVGRELEWSEDRRRDEVDRLRAFYAPASL
jgi:glycerol-3-phosphate dehydrogenase